ncbi:peptide deformylase [Bacillus solimangrovi]|uniref:Peptide deformylase n=1 Tax=Bacillus solimangrovi TaxID=1305675 RepID=A0A1E5LFY6_9BACI|nr:peptide deformylase [Bacillus solimangrovi]OEH92995.1 peptide deformylase [Bacillus solimangrovi]
MLTMKDVVREGHPALREKAKDVQLPANAEDKKTLEKMVEFIINSQDDELAQKYNLRPGVGIAAPQLGIKKRMIVVHTTDEKEQLHSYALFNPKIASHSAQQIYLPNGEGCLSVDREVPGIVPRYAKVTVKAIDINGTPVQLRLRGFPAIVMQHEIDHLNGIMFYDHINSKDPFTPPEGASPIE